MLLFKIHKNFLLLIIHWKANCLCSLYTDYSYTYFDGIIIFMCISNFCHLKIYRIGLSLQWIHAFKHFSNVTIVDFL